MKKNKEDIESLFINNIFREFILSKIELSGEIPVSRFVKNYTLRSNSLKDKGNLTVSSQIDEILDQIKSRDSKNGTIKGVIIRANYHSILVFNGDFSIYYGIIGNISKD